MPDNSVKIVSLLPGTTEIVCALGMEHNLVGRSHECDFPAPVQDLPACTEPKFMPDGTSYQIDQRVKALLQEGLSVYRVDAEQLTDLQPDIIITQDHCEVCAASLSDVKKAVQATLGSGVNVISVSPTDLPGVFGSISTIAEALQVGSKGEKLIRDIKRAFQQIRTKTGPLPKKDIICLEWLDPLMTAGNWVPELVSLAGGISQGAEAGRHSPCFDWQQLSEINPEVIAIMPCGYGIKQTLSEIDLLRNHRGWNQLKAVQKDEVYLLDGNQYFNRPGPRLTDSARILAEILHPDVFPAEHRNKGWIKLQNQNIRAYRYG